MTTQAFVFARGGSKGIPRKNLQILEGKPLLVWSIEMGLRLSDVENVFVSTDDEEIAEISEKNNAIVIQRPKKLAQDDSPELHAWQHAVSWVVENYGNFERFLSLPTTAPLRSIKDVQRSLDALNEQTDVVITMTPAARSPWFNMVKVDEIGRLSLLAEGNYVRRQDAPQSFDMTTVAYVLRPDFILGQKRIWDGVVRGVEVPTERALDIDTPLDLQLAAFLLQNQPREK